MNSRPAPSRLAALARASEQKRDAALLRATTELFVLEVDHDGDEIRRYAQLALHFLPRVAPDDRAFVAERLAACRDAPMAVITILARDIIGVASPVLRHSPVLTPLDLLSVIGATGAEHYRVIARRSSLAPDVERALRLTGDDDVAAYLDEGARMRGSFIARSATASAGPTPAAGHTSNQSLDSLDPWRFLGLDRRSRLRIVADLASRAADGDPGASGARPDVAFRAILSAARIVGFARSGQLAAIVSAISEGLDLAPDLVAAAANDPGGELLAVMLKALRLDDTQAQQVFLLASPSGRDVNAFFPLSDLYSGMEPTVAAALIAAWRAATEAGTPRHETHFAENADRRRSAASSPSRPSQIDEQARRA